MNRHYLDFFWGLLLLFSFASCQDNPYKQGERLYLYHCGNCHMEDGSGLEGLIPPLAQSDYLKNHPERIACIIRYGLSDTIVVNGKTYMGQQMEGIPDLNYFEITNIINYIHHAWGNGLGYKSAVEVERELENCNPNF
jgi:mono/diheme cytochrome c family protein